MLEATEELASHAQVCVRLGGAGALALVDCVVGGEDGKRGPTSDKHAGDAQPPRGPH